MMVDYREMDVTENNRQDTECHQSATDMSSNRTEGLLVGYPGTASCFSSGAAGSPNRLRVVYDR